MNIEVNYFFKLIDLESLHKPKQYQDIFKM